MKKPPGIESATAMREPDGTLAGLSDKPQDKDPRGYRIPVRLLFFKDDVQIGSFFGKSLKCTDPEHHAHWRGWYLPKMHMYLLIWRPAPGTRQETIETFVPREWARYE